MEQEKLKAILSDGDLRRSLAQEEFDLSLPAILYATKDPYRLTDTQTLASKALEEIRKQKDTTTPGNR